MNKIIYFLLFTTFSISVFGTTNSCLLHKLSNLKHGSRYTTISDQFLSEFVVRLSEIEILLKDPKKFENSIEVLELKSESKYIYEKMDELLKNKGVSKSFHQKQKIKDIKNQHLKLQKSFEKFFELHGIPLDYKSLVKMYPIETVNSADDLIKAKQLYSVLLDRIYDGYIVSKSLKNRKIHKNIESSLKIIERRLEKKISTKNSSSILNSPNYNEIVTSGLNTSVMKEVKIGRGMLGAKYLLHSTEGNMVVLKSSEHVEFRLASSNNKEVRKIFGEGKNYLSKRYPIKPGTTKAREVASYKLSDYLDFDLVPVTKEVTLKDGSLGTAQDFKENFVMAFESYDKRKTFMTKSIFDNKNAYIRPDKKQIHEMAVFDLITGAIDRNSANWMLDKNGNIAAIDNGYTFPMETKTSYINLSWENVILKSPDMTLLSSDLVLKIKQLDIKKMAQVMRESNIEEPAIKLMKERVELMQRYVEGKDQVQVLELSKMIKHQMKGNKYEVESFFR